MVYVFDTSSLSHIFNSFYPSIFPSFWNKFEELIVLQQILSIREARNEIEQKPSFLSFSKWINEHSQIFLTPNNDELEFITQIYTVKHFRKNLKSKDILQGKPHADPFVIAKAKVIRGTVVTEEKYTENAAKIPNICKHFSIDCLNLEDFLQRNNCQW